MKKYKKVTDIEVLYKYNELVFGIDSVPITIMAEVLNTSKYQIRKCYRSLAEQGYMELTKICTYGEEYWNGLYDEFIPILYAKAYTLTSKARALFSDKDVELWEKILQK